MLGERLEGDSRFQRLLRSGLVCMCTRSMPVRPQSVPERKVVSTEL